MNVEFTRDGWDDFEYWLENDLESVEKIRVLIKSIKQTPFSGLGKPEPFEASIKGILVSQDKRRTPLGLSGFPEPKAPIKSARSFNADSTIMIK